MFSLRRFALILAAVAAAIVPAISLADDGYPSGTTTPEGAACDYTRAFMQRDLALFEQAVLPPFGDGEIRAQYEQYLADIKSAFLEASKRPIDPGTREIKKVFVARSFSKSSPAADALAAFNFADVKFVDVGAAYDGRAVKNRIIVVKDKTGRWRVHPAPEIHPALNYGINQEPPSTAEVARTRTPPNEPLGLSGAYLYKGEGKDQNFSMKFEGERCFVMGVPSGETNEAKCLRKGNQLYIAPIVPKNEKMTRNVWVVYTVVDNRLESSHLEDMDDGQVFYKGREPKIILQKQSP
ncbi:MAG: hypothetical protein FWC42_10495 [Proteobacteria bacterium]|nr:hypothetical protein [Pseudomonadota bacterium]